MNLKKIELYGFKSFADKLEIEFNSNFTGIVGPNGCGKSNITEAVRWVLGEQRPSIFRCKSMAEIIFSGTTSRRSLSYCEVSLFLSNEKALYPVDYDEIVITRKLYRNGESEYYINKNACRLRDIIDLFRDSGIGREGYSIIAQGKVDEILSAKPETRRQIFEEAAGISRHKARKVETERKLERTRDNLSRINDIITEVSAQLVPLEKEAKNAAEAGALRKQLKMLELYSYLYHTDNSANERDKIVQKLNKIIKELSDKETELDSYNREYSTSMMDITNSDIYANNLREQITEVMVNNEKKEGESRLYTERLNNLIKQAQDINTERIQYEGRLTDREKEKSAKLIAFNELNATLIDKRQQYEQLKAQLDTLNKSVNEQELALEKSNQLLFDSIGKRSEVDKDIVRLELERKMLIDGLGQSKGVYDDKKRLFDGVQVERAKLLLAHDELMAEKNEKTEEKRLADKNLLDSFTELKDTENKKRQLENRKSELEIKINMLEEYKRDYSGYQDVIRRLMNEAQQDKYINDMVLGTVGQVISVPKDIQLAIEVALGGSIQNIITANEHDAGKLIDILKNKHFGRATFLPITTVSANPLSDNHYRVLDEDGVIGVASELIRYQTRFNNIMSNLLGRTVIVEDKEVGIKVSKKYGYGFRIVTLDGVVFAQSGAMTGGSAPGRNTRILSRETELIDLNKKLKNVITELELLTADIDDLNIEYNELDNAVKIINARIHKLDVELENLNVRIQSADSEAKLFKEEMDNLLRSGNVNSARISALDELIAHAIKNQDELNTEKISADDFINESKDKFFNDKQRRDALSQDTTAALMELNTLQNELDSINRDLASNKAEIYHIQQNLLDLKARSATCEIETKNMQAKVDTTAYDDTDKKKLDELRTTLTKLDEHKKSMQNRLNELDTLRTQLSKAISEMVEKKAKEESALDKVATDIENLSIRIQQDYDMDYDSARRYIDNRSIDEHPVDFDPSKAISESLSLRRKIERIGPINELAEEKFKTEKERHEEMSRQYEDLVKAESDLIKIISELTSEMEEKFIESFNKINENFQEVFRDLFRGGSASIELEREKGVSVLDAGIEIKAQPPGLKLTRISLLSGGQKTLTAIAILFAIIKLKPMPFCILDEMEAALDDHNATLFAQYLAKFSQSTQFIVVTHRKPTMTHADTLYGVTMQEKGVSNLVSVQLTDALKTAK